MSFNSSLNGGSTWRPVQSFSPGPVLSSSPTPCQLVPIQSVARSGYLLTPLFTRSRSDHRSAASCGGPLWLCARVPGRLNRFARSRSRVKCVGLALFMQAWSFALRTSCTSRSLVDLHAWLVSILGPADRSCDSNSVHVKPFCLKPSEASRRKPLVCIYELWRPESRDTFHFPWKLGCHT